MKMGQKLLLETWTIFVDIKKRYLVKVSPNSVIREDNFEKASSFQ